MKNLCKFVVLLFVLASFNIAHAQIDDANVYYDVNYKEGFPLFPAVSPDSLLKVSPGDTIYLTWDPVRTIQDSTFTPSDWDKTETWSNVDGGLRWQPSSISGNIVFTREIALEPGAWKFRIWSWLHKPDNTVGFKWTHSTEPSSEIGIMVVLLDDDSIPSKPILFPIVVKRAQQ